MTSSSLTENTRLRVLLTLLAVAPIVVAVIWALTGNWIPVGDDGLLALRIDDVGSANHPWLGSWTSASVTLGEDVNNPGAWYAYLAAGPVALLGPTAGTPVAVGLLNVAAIVGLGWVGRTLAGPRAEVWFLAGAAALGWAMGSELLIDVWQPHALLFPMLLVMALAAGVAQGRADLLPWLLVIASVVVQTHLGYTFILAFIVGSALILGAIARRDVLLGAPTRVLRSRAVLLSVVGTLVAWLPSIIEQLQNGADGNLARLLRNAGGGQNSLGLRNALGVTAETLIAPWSRIRFGGAISDATTLQGLDPDFRIPGLQATWISVLVITVVVIVLLVLLRWARHEGRHGLQTVLTIALVAVPATIGALTVMTVGVLFGAHQVRWSVAVAIFVQVAVAWALFERLRSARPRFDLTFGVAAALVVVLGFANLVPYAQQHGPVADRWARPTLNQVARQLDDLAVEGPIIFDTSNLRPFEPFSGTVMMLLGERGVDFHLPDQWLPQVGEGRAIDGTEIGRLYQLEGAAVLSYEGDDCPIVRASGFDPDEEADTEALVADITDDLYSGRLQPDPALLEGDERLQILTAAIADGDRGLVRQLVLDGVPSEWATSGALNSRAQARVVEAGSRIADWLRTVYGLYLETDGACPS